MEHAVVVAGGGPTGLMLAAELMLAGTDVVIVERRLTQDLDGSRSRGLHARTVEVLDQRGVGERFVSAGQPYPALGYAMIQLDLTDFPSRRNFVLGLGQRDFERILAEWVLGELGAPILRGLDVTGLTQGEAGVDVELSDGRSIRAQYIVGCDGGRSAVRKAAGIDFVGLDPSTSWMIAEVEMTEQPPIGVRPEGGGIGPVDPGVSGGPFGVVLKELEVQRGDAPELDELRALLVARLGSDFGAHSPTWISRFTDMSRQAAEYRRGRVLLAGDAAHVHPPQGGQGLNVGVQDAVNLGWKLAQVVAGKSPDSLLDTYHSERHPVGARVQRNTEAQAALSSADDRHRSLHAAVSELLSMDEPRRSVAGMISGLDVHYDLGGGHPLVGRRMPDLDLETPDGPTRVSALLHEARPVLLDRAGSDSGPGDAVDLSRWADRVQMVDAQYDGVWELPVIGEVEAPGAVLIRPDGHVAWVGAVGDPELTQALETWFGSAG